jgi:hypothetical protein
LLLIVYSNLATRLQHQDKQTLWQSSSKKQSLLSY